MKVYTLFNATRLKNKDKHSLNRYCIIKIYVNNASIKQVGTRLRRIKLLWLSPNDRRGRPDLGSSFFHFQWIPHKDMETMKSGRKSRGAGMCNTHAVVESGEIIAIGTTQHKRRVSVSRKAFLLKNENIYALIQFVWYGFFTNLLCLSLAPGVICDKPTDLFYVTTNC